MEQKNKHICRADLKTFFNVPKRGLTAVLRDAGIELRANGTRWSVVFEALGLAAEQSEEHWEELTSPLLTAKQVAELLGGVSTSIVYRWSKGKQPTGMPPFPKAILLTAQPQPKTKRPGLRWRKAEILAWACNKPMPEYRRLTDTVNAPALSSASPVSEANAAPSGQLPGMFALQDLSEGDAE